MRVLVTNDDGIAAPGLYQLVVALVDAGHDVVVAAPHLEASGSGTALGSLADGTRVPFRETRLLDLPDVQAYAFEAPPAFAVLAGCAGLLGALPDVVVAGVNPGWNTGATVLHSSTVGAAATAASTGRRALAVSCGPFPTSRFDTAAEIAVLALDVLVADQQPGTVLNLNVPDVDLADVRGVRGAPLATRGVHAVKLRREGQTVRLEEFDRSHLPSDDTDSACVLDGWVTATLIHPTYASSGAPAALAAEHLDLRLRAPASASS